MVTSFLTDMVRTSPAVAAVVAVALGILLTLVIFQLIRLVEGIVFAETETPSRRLRALIRELRSPPR